jgi:hypothetical protein
MDNKSIEEHVTAGDTFAGPTQKKGAILRTDIPETVLA